MKRLAALALALLLVPAALAGSYRDDAGDAPAEIDLIRLDWDVGQHIEVAWTLAANASAEASYSAVVFIGLPNASEPEEYYVVHRGPGGDHVLAGHTDPPTPLEFNVTEAGPSTNFRFTRIQASSSGCDFAVAHTSIGAPGEEQEDALPDGDSDPSQAWKQGAYCLADPIGAAIRDRIEQALDDNGLPAPPMVAAAAALLAVAIVARRRA